MEKEKVATYEFTIPIPVLLNASKVSKNPGTKKEVENDLLSCVAPLTDGSCNLICESLVGMINSDIEV